MKSNGPFNLMTGLRSLDALFGVVCFWIVTTNFTPYKQPFIILYSALLFFVITITFHHSGIYRSWRFSSLNQELGRLFYCCSMVVLTLITIAFMANNSNYFQRKTIIIFFIFWYGGIIAGRLLIRTLLHRLRMKGYNIRRAVIVGEGHASQHLLQAIRKNTWTGVNILGMFADESYNLNNDLSFLGNLNKLTAYVKDENVNIVYLCLAVYKEEKITHLLAELSDTDTSVYLIPNIFFYDLVLSSNIEIFDQIPVIGIFDTPVRGINILLKRSEDIIVASLLLLLCTPLLATAAIVIKITSPGPIFFSQWRYGHNGKPFKIYKLRSMTVCEDGYKFKQATRNDKRITKVGYWLRHFSIDELPQLFNVLLGNMAMVGPRPHPATMNEQYRKIINGYMLRHKVKPGITGLAQLRGYRGETDTMQKIMDRLESDLEYVRNWSLELDIKIILQTICSGAWNNNTD